MSSEEKRDGLMVAIWVVLGVVVLAALGIGSLGLARYQTAREQDRRAQAARSLAQIRRAIAEPIVIVGEVESWEPAQDGTVIHACPATVVAPFWIVKFKVLEKPHVDYPSDECNILVHSPAADLGITAPGQKLRLVLRPATRPPHLTAGSEAQLPKVQFADSAGPLDLVSHDQVD